MSVVPELRYVDDRSLNIYRPKHPLYERLKPAPPLLANGLLFLLANFISAGAFKDYSTIKDVLAARPPPRRKLRIVEGANGRNDSGQTLSADILHSQTFSATTRPENGMTSPHTNFYESVSKVPHRRRHIFVMGRYILGILQGR
jgi:hypothetical protein